MGFNISDNQNQIRLRISYQSYETIMQDIAEFQNIPEKEQISSFLNKILNNFWQEADSTIAENKPKIYDKYVEWLKGLENIEQTVEQLTEKEIEDRFSRIKELYSQPPRAKGQNLKLIMTKPTMKMLENSKEKELYKNKISDYLAAIIQEYTALPRKERERIYFRDILKTIDCCIKLGHEVEINNTHILKPFKIATNGFLPYYYAVGYARKKSSKPTADWKLMTFRLQRIHSIEEKEISYEITKEEILELNELFKSPIKIAYLSEDDDEEKVIVRLTKRGYKDYQNKILSGRPAYINKIELANTEKPFVYELTFNCPSNQAYQYFIRFGQEVEIIAPEKLRKGFKNLHENAVKYYK